MMLSAQAKSFYRASVGASHLSDGNLNQSIQEAVEAVMDRVAQGGSALIWSGKNDYVNKWNGKLLPARFAAMLASEFNAITNGAATIKLTTSPDLLVNTNNAPDDWEKRIIETKMVNSNTASLQKHAETVDGAFRLMLGEYYGQGCVGCHGTGPGQEGPSIHPGEIPRGMGDFAGAISISINASPAAAN